MELNVRRAELRDAPAVSAVIEAAYRHDGLYGSDTRLYNLVKDETEHRILNTYVYIAENSAGVAVATRTLSFPGMGYRDIAEANEVEGRRLAVHPNYRGMSVTRLFLEQLTPIMIGMGVEGLVVSTGSQWQTNNIFPRAGMVLNPSRQWWSEKLGQLMNVYTKDLVGALEMAI